ncbi:DUF6303 family protein [Streptomyces sp. S1]|uniref:DUF6303 family protein n=1 Tax=Streptomyces sp. S1 TaxID=718288 RepID=UPI003D707DB0
MSSTPLRVLLSRRCCDILVLSRKAAAQRARWRLFVVLPGPADDWPAFEWPTSRRHMIPTPDERARALASLGYCLAPDAAWSWTEDETPDYHDHPRAVSLLGSTVVVPLPDGA